MAVAALLRKLITKTAVEKEMTLEWLIDYDEKRENNEKLMQSFAEKKVEFTRQNSIPVLVAELKLDFASAASVIKTWQEFKRFEFKGFLQDMRGLHDRPFILEKIGLVQKFKVNEDCTSTACTARSPRR